MRKILTPGPVAIPDFVWEAIQQPVIPHRSVVFEEIYSQLLNSLRYFFQTKGEVISMIASGSGGVESAMYSLFLPGEKVLVVDTGKFSNRWVQYAETTGLDVSELSYEWGSVPKTEDILIKLEKETPKGIILTHCETSTGALLDLEEIAFAVKERVPNCLVVVDAITSVGAVPFYFDDWQLDCAICTSQKSLMNPAGLSVFAMSELAIRKLRATFSGDYQNLKSYLTFAQQHNYPFTPPVNLLFGVKAALAWFQQQKLPNVWNQTHQTAQYFRSEIQQLGAKLLAKSPSDSLTAFYFEQGDHQIIKQKLAEEYQIEISGGQGPYKGKLLRVNHMGETGIVDMQEVLSALKSILK
ncbi:MAG: alanine--glyoxylate aminotransferase family protein [Bacteroidota bacterium]